MKDDLFVSNGSVEGTVDAYPSKSYAQRILLLGLMSRSGIEIKNYGKCSDSEAVKRSVISLGAGIEGDDRKFIIKGPLKFNNSDINCCQSGLCMRMFAPVLSLSGEDFRLFGDESLLKRSNEHIPEILGQLGAECSISGRYLHVKGPLKSGIVKINKPVGSQLVSGLLYVLSIVEGDSKILITDPVSVSYIRMTADLLNRFGAGINMVSDGEISISGGRQFCGGSITVEGDWSSAAFFLVAGAIAGRVRVSGLNEKSIQPDRAILDYLSGCGARVSTGRSSIEVSGCELKGFSADIKDHPDLFIPLVILALNCNGESRIYNYGRLKHKESDRPAAIIDELLRAGAKISQKENFISIEKSSLSLTEMRTYDDHRLAMGFATAALTSTKGLWIKDPSCVNKSFPLFFDMLESIRSGREE